MYAQKSRKNIHIFLVTLGRIIPGINTVGYKKAYKGVSPIYKQQCKVCPRPSAGQMKKGWRFAKKVTQRSPQNPLLSEHMQIQ